MGKLYLTLLLGIAAFLATSTQRVSAAEPEAKTFGTEVPFPYGTEVPFPWSTIVGIWEAQDSEIDAYFSFRVQYNDQGKKILEVRHTRRSGVLVAKGAGILDENQRIVRAIMHGGRSKYMMFIRAYHDKEPRCCSLATVLTIRHFQSSVGEDEHFILRKISGTPPF